MSTPRAPRHLARLPVPANDNKPQHGELRAEVQIPQDLPVTQAEIEVFAVLLHDWDCPAGNDNEGPAE